MEGPPHPFRLEEVGNKDVTIQAVPASTLHQLLKTVCLTSAAGKEQHSQGLFVPEDLKWEGLSPSLQIQLSPVAEEPA